MRDDIDKLLVTRPRIGHKMRNEEVKEARNSKDYESLPSYSSMKPKSKKGERKSFSEYFPPLKGFLRKSCNRPWDKIYSEICEKLDKNSTVKAHVFIHLSDFVETSPYFINGIPHESRWGSMNPIYHDGWRYFVDQAGIMRKPPNRPKHKQIENPNLLETDDAIYVCREDGTWFQLTLIENLDFWSFYKVTPKWIIDLLGPWRLRNARIKLRTLTKKEKKTLGFS